MEHSSRNPHELPAGISEYIRKNFRDDYLTQIREVHEKNGEVYYFVDISHDDNLYHLKFNSRGVLVQQELEYLPEFPEEGEIGNEE